MENHETFRSGYIYMSDSNVIPFRKRPPSEIELEMYERMTRAWHPELKALMFPEHFRQQQDREERQTR